MRSYDGDDNSNIDSEVESIDVLQTTKKKLTVDTIRMPQVLTLKRSYRSMPDLPNTRVTTYDTKYISREDLHIGSRAPVYEAWGDRTDHDIVAATRILPRLKACDSAASGNGSHIDSSRPHPLCLLHDPDSTRIGESRDKLHMGSLSPLYREVKVDPTASKTG